METGVCIKLFVSDRLDNVFLKHVLVNYTIPESNLNALPVG